MKVDFNKEGMSIHFDKVPRLIYYNENGESCGTVFIDGKKIKLLQEVNIHAKSNDMVSHPLEYNIAFYDPKIHGSAGIATGKSAFNELAIPVKIIDMEPFKCMVETLKQFITDSRISAEIRQESENKILSILNKSNMK